jgi:hypothetical protein
VQPAIDMLTNSGLDVGDGIMVNEYLETSRADVLAAGVANYQDVLFGKRRRVEHWDNAVSQGQYCAQVIMGERVPGTCLISFLTSSIWRMNIGAIRQARTKPFIAAISLLRVSAYGGYVRKPL